MLANGDALNPFVHYPFLLPSVILFQILITWYFVYRYAHSKDDKNESVIDEI
jgi:hypothetical protein